MWLSYFFSFPDRQYPYYDECIYLSGWIRHGSTTLYRTTQAARTLRGCPIGPGPNKLYFYCFSLYISMPTPVLSAIRSAAPVCGLPWTLSLHWTRRTFRRSCLCRSVSLKPSRAFRRASYKTAIYCSVSQKLSRVSRRASSKPSTGNSLNPKPSSSRLTKPQP